DGIRDFHVTGVQTCALPIFRQHEIGYRDFQFIFRRGGHGGLNASNIFITDEANRAAGETRQAGYLDWAMSAQLGLDQREWVGRRSEERRVGKECRSRWGRGR